MGKFAGAGNRRRRSINTRGRAGGRHKFTRNLCRIYAAAPRLYASPPAAGLHIGSFRIPRSEDSSTLSAISGLVVGGGGGATLWYLKPRNGVANPLVEKPWLDFMIPIGIVTAIGFGVALIVAGWA